MIELIDNLSQFIAVLVGGVWAGIWFYQSRRQEYLLLACFYGTFTLGSLYWVTFQLITNYTPHTFYVSDLAWIASFLFLLTLELTLPTEEERRYWPPAMWLPLLPCVPLLLFYYQWGDWVTDTLWCGLTMVSACLALRGLLYAKKQGAARHSPTRALHITILFFVAMEYCVWTASCFWVSDTLTNPYFWFDFLLTAAALTLLPAARKAVEA